MVNWTGLTLFIYIAARMAGFVLINPILGRQGIPAMFKTGFALMLSVSVIAVIDQPVAVPAGVFELMVRIILEFALGYLLSMITSFFFYIPQLAGEVVDTQMGMTMNQIYDATSQANMSVTGTLLNTLMMLLFFAGNGHHTLIRLMLTSGQIVPYGTAAISTEAVNAMLALFTECTLLAVKLAMPILVAELAGQVGMGILMKVIPQINVFAINIDLKVLIGLGMLLVMIAPFSEFLLQAEATMLNSMEEVLSLTAG